MDYLLKIDTAHSTYTESAPLVSRLKLTKGRLVGGWLYFPAGPAGTLNLQVKLGLHQILPFTVGESYALNGCVIPLNIDLDILQHPLSLDILTWNTSITYEHTCSLCLFLDPVVPPRSKQGWWTKLVGK